MITDVYAKVLYIIELSHYMATELLPGSQAHEALVSCRPVLSHSISSHYFSHLDIVAPHPPPVVGRIPGPPGVWHTLSYAGV
jgi:hypothetical protein